VLGGGGALGCAHLGVARALREAGIEIDVWGGSSVGGAMAVALSRGLLSEEVMDRFETIFVTNAALGRMTVPRHSLMNHRHFDAQMREHYGEDDLADHPMLTFAVSASLTTNDLHVHRRGPAWIAVRASGSLPIMLPPYVTETGEVLADGGLIDNLPISTMRDMKTGPNLLVNLSSDREYRLTSSYDAYTTGAASLFAMMRGRRAGDLPSTVKTLLRAMVVSSQRKLADTVLGDDLLLQPKPVRGMSITDWKRGREQERQAYEFAARRIEDGNLDRLLGTRAG
ncbi:MAG: patatin-like phospholipase family protein, partial [Jannaschia sp.]